MTVTALLHSSNRNLPLNGQMVLFLVKMLIMALETLRQALIRHRLAPIYKHYDQARLVFKINGIGLARATFLTVGEA